MEAGIFGLRPHPSGRLRRSTSRCSLSNPLRGFFDSTYHEIKKGASKETSLFKLVEVPEIAEQVQGMHDELTKSVLMSAGIIIRESESLSHIPVLRDIKTSCF